MNETFASLPPVDLFFPRGGKRFRPIWEDLDRPRTDVTRPRARSQRQEKQYQGSERR